MAPTVTPSMSEHAVVALWNAAGNPPPNWTGKAKTARATPDPRQGTCALTGIRGDVYPAKHVISDLFTALDRLPFDTIDPEGLAFGVAAAWAIRCRLLMQQPHAIIDGCLTRCTPRQLFDALVNIGPHSLVLVPQSRQKHLAPWALFGQVTVDNESLRWDGDDVERLGTYRALRTLGYGEAALAEPSPRWPVLQRGDVATKCWTLAHWGDLDLWRHHDAYLDVAARATRKPKDDDGATTDSGNA